MVFLAGCGSLQSLNIVAPEPASQPDPGPARPSVRGSATGSARVGPGSGSGWKERADKVSGGSEDGVKPAGDNARARSSDGPYCSELSGAGNAGLPPGRNGPARSAVGEKQLLRPALPVRPPPSRTDGPLQYPTSSAVGRGCWTTSASQDLSDTAAGRPAGAVHGAELRSGPGPANEPERYGGFTVCGGTESRWVAGGDGLRGTGLSGDEPGRSWAGDEVWGPRWVGGRRDKEDKALGGAAEGGHLAEMEWPRSGRPRGPGDRVQREQVGGRRRVWERLGNLSDGRLGAAPGFRPDATLATGRPSAALASCAPTGRPGAAPAGMLDPVRIDDAGSRPMQAERLACGEWVSRVGWKEGQVRSPQEVAPHGHIATRGEEAAGRPNAVLGRPGGPSWHRQDPHERTGRTSGGGGGGPGRTCAGAQARGDCGGAAATGTGDWAERDWARTNNGGAWTRSGEDRAGQGAGGWGERRGRPGPQEAEGPVRGELWEGRMDAVPYRRNGDVWDGREDGQTVAVRGGSDWEEGGGDALSSERLRGGMDPPPSSRHTYNSLCLLHKDERHAEPRPIDQQYQRGFPTPCGSRHPNASADSRRLACCFPDGQSEQHIGGPYRGEEGPGVCQEKVEVGETVGVQVASGRRPGGETAVRVPAGLGLLGKEAYGEVDLLLRELQAESEDQEVCFGLHIPTKVLPHLRLTWQNYPTTSQTTTCRRGCKADWIDFDALAGDKTDIIAPFIFHPPPICYSSNNTRSICDCAVQVVGLVIGLQHRHARKIRDTCRV
jgi:hypothetical protein